MQQRIDSIDGAKALGIFLVIYAHTMLWKPLQDWIYVFHMPLFFFISGYLFSFARHQQKRSFIRQRFHRLMVPYFAINLVTYLFWLFVARHVGSGHDGAVSPLMPLKAALLGNGPMMLHDVPLWFLMCLFVVEIGYYALCHNKSRTTRICITAAIALLGFANSQYNPVTLPFSLGTAMVALVFYSLGHESRLAGIRFRNTAVAILCVAATIAVAHFNGRINMHKNFYNHYLPFLAGGICGTYATMWICTWAESALPSICLRALRFISRNTLYICGFHLMSFTFIKGIMVYVMHIRVSVMDDGVWLNLAFSVVSLIFCSVGIMVAQKCARLESRAK